MKLKEFVEKVITHNSIVRLVYQTNEGKGGSHVPVLDGWAGVEMEWKILKGGSLYDMYLDHDVLGITSIQTHSYVEAINIVIKRIPQDELRDIRIDKLLS